MTRFTDGFRFPPKAEHSSRDLLDPLTLNGADGTDSYSLIVNNETIIIPCDADLSNPVFTNAITTISVFKGTEDISSQCNFQIPFGITGYTHTISDNVIITLTGIDGPITTPSDFVVNIITIDQVVIQRTIRINTQPKSVPDPIAIGDLDTNTMEMDGGLVSTKLIKEGTGSNSVRQVNAASSGVYSAAFNASTAKMITGFSIGNNSQVETIFVERGWENTTVTKRPLLISSNDFPNLINKIFGNSVFLEINLYLRSSEVSVAAYKNWYQKRIVVITSEGIIATNDIIYEGGDYASRFGSNPSVDITYVLDDLQISITPIALIVTGNQHCFAEIRILGTTSPPVE